MTNTDKVNQFVRNALTGESNEAETIHLDWRPERGELD